MELLKMTSEDVIHRKRPLDDGSNICNHRTMVQAVRDFPPGCGTMVQAVRDFPPGCGINEAERKLLKTLTKAHSDLGNITSHGNETKPKELERNKSYVVSRPASKVKFWDPTCTKATIRTKNFDNVDMSSRKMTPDSEKALVSARPVENSKVKSFEARELVRSKSYLGARSTAKVKFWDPTCEVQKSEDTTTVVSAKEKTRRKKIKEAMALFDQVYESIYQENKMKRDSEKIPPSCVPMEVAKIVKRKLKWMDPEKIAGSVCGVQIGDKFKFRSQLMMVGLHSQPHSGIDYANIEGQNVAISVVDARRYSNESGSSDTLIYSGHGGSGLYGSNVPAEDQKLVRGNMAMKNSIETKTPVRVMRKVGGFGNDVFVYDGLYVVEKCTQGKSEEGKVVFKFHLERVPGQPSLHNMMSRWVNCTICAPF
ncbi:putative [histone H3]-lysine(4) N-trimethyltransferase [Helianthus debilis subsp. tardiflorus]